MMGAIEFVVAVPVPHDVADNLQIQSEMLCDIRRSIDVGPAGARVRLKAPRVELELDHALAVLDALPFEPAGKLLAAKDALWVAIAQAVTCPTCRSLPGAPCVVVNGDEKGTPRHEPHASRRRSGVRRPSRAEACS